MAPHINAKTPMATETLRIVVARLVNRVLMFPSIWLSEPPEGLIGMAAAQSGNDWRIGDITQSSGRMSPHRHLRQARCVSDASLSGSRVTIQSAEKHANSQMSPQRPPGVTAACFAAVEHPGRRRGTGFRINTES